LASCTEVNSSRFRNSSLNLLLNDSTNGLSQDGPLGNKPGLMQSVSQAFLPRLRAWIQVGGSGTAQESAAQGARSSLLVGSGWRHESRQHQSVGPFGWLGHRITGDLRLGNSPGAGFEMVHVVVDDATRLAPKSRFCPMSKNCHAGWLYGVSRGLFWQPRHHLSQGALG